MNPDGAEQQQNWDNGGACGYHQKSVLFDFLDDWYWNWVLNN